MNPNIFLQDTSIIVHFHSKREKYNKIETIGKLSQT